MMTSVYEKDFSDSEESSLETDRRGRDSIGRQAILLHIEWLFGVVQV